MMWINDIIQVTWFSRYCISTGFLTHNSWLQFPLHLAGQITSFFSVITYETTNHSTIEQLCRCPLTPHQRLVYWNWREDSLHSVTGKLMLCWHSLNYGHDNVLWLKIMCDLIIHKQVKILCTPVPNSSRKVLKLFEQKLMQSSVYFKQVYKGYNTLT